MVFRRVGGAYAIAAVLVALVVAALVFAGSALSQDKAGDSKKERKEDKREKRTQSSSTRTENNRATQNPTRTQQVGAQATPDVTITKEAEPEVVEVGEFLIYTLVVTNNTLDEQVVVVEDDLPEEVDFFSVSVSGGTEDECEDNNSDPEVVCAITLGPDDSDNTTDEDEATIQIVVQADEVGEDLDNVADVFAADETTTTDPFDTIGRRFDRARAEIDIVRNDGRQYRDRFDRFDQYRDDFFTDEDDIDNDGDVDQEDEFLDAQNDLEDDETTDGELTDGDNFDDLGDDDGPAVSATADDGQAEASTPGAVASAGGDPDELEPLTSIPEGVEDEIPTSGPLPNTGGVPLWVYALPLLGGLLLFGAALIRRLRSAS